SNQLRPRISHSPLFPYETLFRSLRNPTRHKPNRIAAGVTIDAKETVARHDYFRKRPALNGWMSMDEACSNISSRIKRPVAAAWRSEEHTSELQSRENLVCRLLLE